MSEHRCLAAAGVGGLALAAILLTPRAVTAGARAGHAALDWLTDKAVRL